MEKKNIIESKTRVLWNFSLSLSYFIGNKISVFHCLKLKMIIEISREISNENLKAIYISNYIYDFFIKNED